MPSKGVIRFFPLAIWVIRSSRLGLGLRQILGSVEPEFTIFSVTHHAIALKNSGPLRYGVRGYCTALWVTLPASNVQGKQDGKQEN